MMGQFKKDIEKVKAAVTEQVTKEVTERVTNEVTARMDKELTELRSQLDEKILEWHELFDESQELRRDKNRLTNRNRQLEKEKEKIQKELDLTGKNFDIRQSIYNLQREVVKDINKLLPQGTKAFTKLEHAREYHGAFDQKPSISHNGLNGLHNISAVINAPANSYVHGNRPLIQENMREAFRMLNGQLRENVSPDSKNYLMKLQQRL
jgi:chromosome segregation ATPase